MALDTGLLGLYLADHLAGATAGLSRAERMCEQHADLPVHAGLVQLREELRRERELLIAVIEAVGTHRRPARQAAAWVGEKVGRLKLNRRVTSRSPMSPLLELELLRGAVMAKQGLWQVLEEYAGELGLERRGVDPAQFARLTALADEQRERLAAMHATLRPATFSG